MSECIFCKISQGIIKTRKVYEDEDVIGILDINPRFAKGQCVVIPKKHVEQFYDLNDVEVSKLFRGVSLVARKIKKAFNVDYVSIFTRGKQSHMPMLYAFQLQKKSSS